MTDQYAKAGVNTAEGDSFSKYAGEACRKTFNNSPFVETYEFDTTGFRGPRAYRFVNLPSNYLMDGAPDGTGTKVILIDAAQEYHSAVCNPWAMTGGDLTRWGGLPLVFYNVLDARSIGKRSDGVNTAFRAMIDGMVRVANEQGVVSWRGETAELPDCVSSDNRYANAVFNWAAVMHGVYLPDRIITGESVRPGQVVMALREHGARSNGFSLIRSVIREQFGIDWAVSEEAQETIREAARPAKIYDRFLTFLNGWGEEITEPRINVHYIAHISGGGIVDKFAKDFLFRHGLSAELDSLFTPPDFLLNIVEWGNISDREAYKDFSSGNGTLVVIDESDVAKFVQYAGNFEIEAQRAGNIVKKDKPELIIHSRYRGETLTY